MYSHLKDHSLTSSLHRDLASQGSIAASPLCSPREAMFSTPALQDGTVLVAARGGSPTGSLSADLARRLAEVDAAAKGTELARRLADVQAEAKLVAQTKQEVEIEFTRCKQTIERAYVSVLTRPARAVGDEFDDGAMHEAVWWNQEQRRRDAETMAYEDAERQRRAAQLAAWEEEDRRRWEMEEEGRRQALSKLWDAEEAELRRAAEAKWEAQQLKERAAAEQHQVSCCSRRRSSMCMAFAWHVRDPCMCMACTGDAAAAGGAQAGARGG